MAKTTINDPIYILTGVRSFKPGEGKELYWEFHIDHHSQFTVLKPLNKISI